MTNVDVVLEKRKATKTLNWRGLLEQACSAVCTNGVCSDSSAASVKSTSNAEIGGVSVPDPDAWKSTPPFT